MSAVDFTSVPSGISLSKERIDQLSERATEVATAFHRRIEKILQTVADAREEYSQEAKRIINSATPEDRETARRLAKNSAASKLVNIHRQLIASSDSERKDMLERLQTYATEAAAIAEVFGSPATMLGRIALGESKRTQYQNQLAEAGPVELITAARIAIMTEDVVLAAAIVTVVDRRPHKRRPFTVQTFAERLMGDEWKRIKTSLDGVQLAYQKAFAADREFVRGKADPISNVSLALAEKAIETAKGEISSQHATNAQ